MIHNLSEIITNFLASKKVINENESDIYIYGYETFFSGVIDLIITLILGILFRRLITAIVFFVMFVSVRMYTGGYHADSYLKCKMIFIGIIISVLGVTYIKFPLYIVFLIIALFLITVYCLCPNLICIGLYAVYTSEPVHIGICTRLFWRIFLINCVNFPCHTTVYLQKITLFSEKFCSEIRIYFLCVQVLNSIAK